MQQRGRLEGRVAVITGAGSGIGQATAIRFAEEGARLFLADMNEAGLQDTLRRLESAGHEAHIQKCNVAVEKEVREFIGLALEAESRVDIVCNIAGIAGGVTALEAQDAADWHRVFEVNLMGAVFTTKYVAKPMQEQQAGAIVNVASVAGIRSGAGGNAYSASKAALINFTLTSACDLGGANVRVNVVCPGLIETGMTRPIFDYARKRGKAEKLGARCELRRYGTPAEVASVILFLASDEASYITGQALAVDGGNTASLNLPGMKL